MNQRAARLASMAVLLLAGPASAQVYAWEDEQGTVHFTEEPPPRKAKARKIPLERIAPPAERPPPARPAGAPVAPAAAALAPRPSPSPRPAPPVLLYTTSGCPWCLKAREWFSGKGVAFTENDIEADPRALERKLRLDGHRRVPTAVIGEKVVHGYAPEKYRAALEGR